MLAFLHAVAVVPTIADVFSVAASNVRADPGVPILAGIPYTVLRARIIFLK